MDVKITIVESIDNAPMAKIAVYYNTVENAVVQYLSETELRIAVKYELRGNPKMYKEALCKLLIYKALIDNVEKHKET